MAHSMQGVYAPLPQSLSDSDSEKEISMEPICQTFNTKNSNFDSGGYRQNGVGSYSHNEVIKIKSNGPAKAMSTTRKAAFIFSIILCFLPIIVFLFVLPCSELSTCPVKVPNWEYSEHDIELKGSINVVSGLYRTTLNLAVLYKGSFNSEKPLKNGIISLMGTNGAVAWDFAQEVEPDGMDCNVIDVDNNGNFDCLVADERGLKIIETISGQTIWHANSEEQEKIIEHLELPVKLQDLNNDGVPELLTIYRKESLLIISGKNGKALRNIKLPTPCSSVSSLTLLVYANVVTYSCESRGNSSLYAIPLSEIRTIYENVNHKFTPMDFVNENANNIFASGKRKLVIENNSKTCKISLHNEEQVLLKTWFYQNCFIMNPRPFSFAPTSHNLVALKGHINGFVLKLWQWEGEKIHQQSEISDKIVKLKNAKRSLSSAGNTTYYLQEVKERVVLITFNNTDIHEINASLVDINQLCFNSNKNRNSNDSDNHSDSGSAVICQPDQQNQRDSLFVVDLDRDKYQELVNFYSSYEKREDLWLLTSYLKIFRLEEELPKLYGSK